MSEIKRYYPFGKETKTLWQSCPILRSILRDDWLTRQSQNQLLWNAHPLFFDMYKNPPAVEAIEVLLERTPEKIQYQIKDELKLFNKLNRNNWRDRWYSFLSEIFVMLRLASKGIGFDYPAANGITASPDLIIPDLNNLEIEITSSQSRFSDGVDDLYETLFRWKTCLLSFEYDLHFELLTLSRYKYLTDSDWIEGCQCFQDYINKTKEPAKNEICVLMNNTGTQLARLKYMGKSHTEDLRISYFPTRSTTISDPDEDIDNFIRKATWRIKHKSGQLSTNSGLICLDVSLMRYKEESTLRIPVKGIPESIFESIGKLFNDIRYRSVVGLVLFKRLMDQKNIQTIGVIPNSNSTLAEDSPKFYEEALRIFE